MSARFEELDWRETPMGEISLRRRREPSLDVDVFEVQARRRVPHVQPVHGRRDRAVPARPRRARRHRASTCWSAGSASATPPSPRSRTRGSRSLTVVEALPEVVDWHERRLLPEADAAGLRRAHPAGRPPTSSPRSAPGGRLDPAEPDRTYDVLLVDIDHSPRHVLHLSHAVFYSAAGLRRMRRRLRPGGVFALWSDDPPDDDFVALLRGGVRRRRRARRGVRQLPHRRHVGQHGLRRALSSNQPFGHSRLPVREPSL